MVLWMECEGRGVGGWNSGDNRVQLSPALKYIPTLLLVVFDWQIWFMTCDRVHVCSRFPYNGSWVTVFNKSSSPAGFFFIPILNTHVYSVTFAVFHNFHRSERLQDLFRIDFTAFESWMLINEESKRKRCEGNNETEERRSDIHLTMSLEIEHDFVVGKAVARNIPNSKRLR